MKDVTNAQCYSCSLASVCPNRETFLNVYAHSDEVMCKCGASDSNEDDVANSTKMDVIVQHRFLDGPGLEEIYKGLGMNAPSSCALVPGNRCPLHWRHPYDSPIMGHWHRPLGYISAICQSPVSKHELGRTPFIPKEYNCRRCLHAGSLKEKPDQYTELGGTDYSTFFTGIASVGKWSKIPLDVMLQSCMPTNLMSGYVVDRKMTLDLFEFSDDPSTPVVIYWRYTQGKPVPVPAEAPDGYTIIETPESEMEMFKLGICFGDMTATYPGMDYPSWDANRAHVDIAWVESGNGIWSNDQQKVLVAPGEGCGIKYVTKLVSGGTTGYWMLNPDEIRCEKQMTHRLPEKDNYVGFKLPFGCIVHLRVLVPAEFMLFTDMIQIMNPWLSVMVEQTRLSTRPTGATEYYISITPNAAEDLYFNMPIIYKKYQIDPVNFPLMEYKDMQTMNVRWVEYYCLLLSQERYVSVPVTTYPRAFQKLSDLTPSYSTTVPHIEKEISEYFLEEPDNFPPIEGGGATRDWFEILGYTYQFQGRAEFNPFITVYEPNKCVALESDVPNIPVPGRGNVDGTTTYKDPSYLCRPISTVYYGKTGALDEGLAAVYTLDYERIRSALIPGMREAEPKLRVEPLNWRAHYPDDSDVRDQIFFGEMEPDTATDVPVYQKEGSPIIDDAVFDFGVIPYNGKLTIGDLIDKVDEALAPVMDSDEFELEVYLVPMKREFMGIHILDDIVYNKASIRATVVVETDSGESGPDEEFGGHDDDLPFTMGGETVDENETIITQADGPEHSGGSNDGEVTEPDPGETNPEPPTEEDEKPVLVDPGMSYTPPEHTFEELEPYKILDDGRIDCSQVCNLRPEETYQVLMVMTPKCVTGFHNAQYCYFAVNGVVQFSVVEVPVTVYGEEPECRCQCDDCKIYRHVERRKSEYQLCPGDDDIILSEDFLGDPSAPVTVYFFDVVREPWRLKFYHISEVTYKQSLNVVVEYNELVKRGPQFITTHSDGYEIDGGEIAAQISIELLEDTSLVGLSVMSGTDFECHTALVKIDEETGQPVITENVNTANYSIAAVRYHVDDGKRIDVTFVARRDMKFIVSYMDGNMDKNASCSRCKGYVDMKEYPWITWTPTCEDYKSY